MPVLYTHLVPATFGGKARMNVANALAAAAAAWAAGAHLHDIRQGLRTFTTSFFQAPGRLNLVEQGGIRFIIDYSHNVDGMRQLADFVRRMVEVAPTKGGASTQRGRAIGVIGIPGDRRDADQHDYGYLAAGAFDELYVREDRNLRGRKPGRVGGERHPRVRAARAKGESVATKVEKILDETAAVRMAIRRAVPGDLVVCCVDDAVGVYRLANELLGVPGGASAISDPGELEAPAG